MWSPPQLLPVKRSWHFGARQRRWLPALEVSIWPQSQCWLPGPSPLTSADPDRTPQQAHCHPACASMGPFRGWAKAPAGGALPPPSLGCPWPQPSLVWVGGGLAVAKAAGSQGSITEDWIVDRGHRNAPHVTRLQGALPTQCPLSSWAAGLPRGPHLRAEQQGLPSIH